ncbi:hypothetical protein L4D09_19740 [Photobacterium makurazakiensis]|uniref:hypothetical protein n=1 Tax=Photobacterium makurazakiensis TaxID=2910234 RepID=UPI003D0B449C
MKRFILTSLMIVSFNSLGSDLSDNGEISMLDILKSTPVTSYEIGRLRLEIATKLSSQEVSGKRVKGTKFKVKGISLVEREDSLGMSISYIGKSKYVTNDYCKQLQAVTKERFRTDRMAKDLWPMLSDNKLKLVAEDLFVSTVLVDENNDQLFRQCD